MRKRQTFLLTIISSENEDACFCGKLKVISSGKTVNFSNLNEFYDLISSELEPEPASNLPGVGMQTYPQPNENRQAQEWK
jgi:hypothetical protein